jgi:dTDP-4-dehydrorhamnose 3,5-epimerase
MQALETSIQDVFKIKSDIYEDSRGFFFEAFNQKKFEDIIKQNTNFVQDNHSKSSRNVLRGLHYQIDHVQAKLVRVIQGEVFDVIVDLRKYSNTFGQWEGHALSDKNKEQLWIPEGCAHGFLVLSDTAEVLYKTTDYYAPQFERCLIWNDKTINIKWPHQSEPILSQKDSLGQSFKNLDYFL